VHVSDACSSCHGREVNVTLTMRESLIVNMERKMSTLTTENQVCLSWFDSAFNNPVKISKDAKLSASLQSSLLKLIPFLFLSSVAENHKNIKLGVGLGKMPLQSYLSWF
jgi:hypothetical protein